MFSISLIGKGYGTEVIKIVLRFVFEQLKLNDLQLEVFNHNICGIRAYEKGERRNLTSILILLWRYLKAIIKIYYCNSPLCKRMYLDYISGCFGRIRIRQILLLIFECKHN